MMQRLLIATILLLLFFATSSHAQVQSEPFVLNSSQTEIRVWTSGTITYARVKVTVGDGSYRVDWGQITRANSIFSVDIPGTHDLIGTTPIIVELSHIYELGGLTSGTYSFSVTSRGQPVRSLQFDRDQSIEHWEPVPPRPQQGYVAISSAGGVSFVYPNLHFDDWVYRVTDWGVIARNGSDFSLNVKAEEWTGAPAQSKGNASHTYSLGNTPPGLYSFALNLNGVLVQKVTFNPLNQQGGIANPIDHPDFFVRQHYLDFLNREPDSAGLTFWTHAIGSCFIYNDGTSSCEPQRANVSAAFFLSIEFQETGYLVYRAYRASYGNLTGAPVPLKFNEFLPDTRQIGQGVIVNEGNWQQQLEKNKQAFFAEFVQRSRFVSAYPLSMIPTQFVDALHANAGFIPSMDERQAAIDEFSGAVTSADNAARSRVLRRVAENPQFARQEFNRAFVLMEYFAYLRRNPNDAPDSNFDGYDFWLNKLNQFNGDFQKAEMLKAFITSGEYRNRFGP